MKLSLFEALSQRKEASVVVVGRGPEILSVSRGLDKQFDLGLPGGKLDPGEDALTAAIRELWEETGLIANPENIRHIFSGKNDRKWTVHTFALDDYGGVLKPSHEGHVKWVDPIALVQKGCTFQKYNKKILSKLGLI